MPVEFLTGLSGAILGAVLTGLFAWWLQSNQQINDKKQELRKIIMEFLKLREEYFARDATIDDPQKREASGISFNTKRVIYLEEAESLANAIPNYVSSSIYDTLAYEFMQDSNFSKAEEYLKRAVKASQTVILKCVALRSLGVFYFGPGPLHSFDLGREYFKQAVDLIKNPVDPYSLYTLGYSYEIWGLQEMANGFENEGLQQIDRARKYYRDLPNNHPLRDQYLGMLDNKVAGARAWS